VKIKLILLVGVVLVTAVACLADVLKLKQGGSIHGLLVSANSQDIVFLGLDGREKTYRVTEVASLDFAPLPPPPAPKPPPSRPVITIPAGTQISVRMIDSIDGKTATAGGRYRASIDDPVNVGSHTAIPHGANCTVEVVNIESGEGMALRLRDVQMGGKTYSTYTEYADVDATGTSKKKKPPGEASGWLPWAQA
jgi:hypothetical protein